MKAGLAALGRYFHTVRYLRPAQLPWLLWRRLRPFRQVRGAVELGAFRQLPVPAFLPPAAPDCGPDTLCFLNVSRPLDLARMDWVAAEMPKLWCYNLHYFDYLHWPQLPAATKDALVDSWIAANPQGTENAWEPYTLSLRVVNWAKYFAGRPEAPPAHWRSSLALQLAWLERNLEHHLRANHLYKNAKALFYAGAFFTGARAQRLRQRGLRLLLAETSEQFLADGGHYERSPMYHAIGLEDLLDAVALVTADPALAAPAEAAALREAAGRALAFLAGIVHADGEIPLFNDAAFGIAPPTQALLAWGRAVLSAQPVGANSFATSCANDGGVANEFAPTEEACVANELPPAVICFPDTGYFGYRHGGDSLVIDCGPVGPDYQPGHAHSDTLSFELCLDGRRVIVDSGTYDYQAGPLRARLRGTAAHNTVMVDGQEQSEVWGVFRVARRARPLAVELGPWRDGRLEFCGAHDGYHRLPGRVTHRRRLQISCNQWIVTDEITGSGQHRLLSALHLHPDCAVTQADHDLVEVRNGDGMLLHIRGNGGQLRREPSTWCPQFGVARNSHRIVLEHAGALPVKLRWRIERVSHADTFS
jgi:uncharacterized heparinase superfamily protein